MALQGYSVRILDPVRFGDAFARVLERAWSLRMHGDPGVHIGASSWLLRSCAKHVIPLPRQTLSALIRGTQKRITHESWTRIARLLRATDTKTRRARATSARALTQLAKMLGGSVADSDVRYQEWTRRWIVGRLTLEDKRLAPYFRAYSDARRKGEAFLELETILSEMRRVVSESIALPSAKALREGQAHSARVAAKLRRAKQKRRQRAV